MPGLDLWYKNAVIYTLDVDSFMDGNDDGVGDFEGLTKRLDYIDALGFNCIWLLPFYPTAGRDNGYDIVDFYDVDPRLGNLGDFVEFEHQARMRGIRVIIDLVVNHTSDQHPWFRAARSDPRSPFRKYYVWSEERPKDAHEGVVFPGAQDATWTFDRKARAWYHHRFFEYQPDLNIAEPDVRNEIRKIMGFWLQLGVSGFRMDAAPFVIEETGADASSTDLVYGHLREFREFLSWRRSDAVLLAEANVKPEAVLDYFGDGNHLQMMFNFWLNQHLFLALATESGEPLVRGLTSLPKIPEAAQWGMFLRNHDELDLGRLSNFEREQVYAAFGPSAEMQLFGRGIRRRLAPMLDGDQRRIKLALSLLFTLPGTPVLWYGDEIGMGEDLALQERESVRTPMQWSARANGGFSKAPPERLFRPVVDRGAFGYERVNVRACERAGGSILNMVERMTRVRKAHHEFGWGEYRVVDTSQANVFALASEFQGQRVVALHNLAGTACRTKLDLSKEELEPLADVLGDSDYAPVKRGALELQPYGFRWLASSSEG